MTTWRQWLERNPAGRGEIYHSEFDIDLDKPWDEPEPSSVQRDRGRLLSTPEAAEYLNLSVWTIRRLVYSGELKAIRHLKHWRFDRQGLDSYIGRNLR